MMRKPQLLWPLVAGMALALAACSGSGSDDPSEAANPGGEVAATASPAPPTCPDERPHDTGPFELRITEIEREAQYYVPSDYDGVRAMPLVVAFHGFTMNPEFFIEYSGLAGAAERDGFVLAAPEAAGDVTWDPASPGDLGFISRLLDDVTEKLCVDAERIFVAGYSNGSGMAQATACAMPERVAAVALVAATYQQCRENVPLIAFHGVDDPIAPFEGSERVEAAAAGVFPNVRRALSEWAKGAGCDGLAAISRPSPDVELSTYRRCFRGDGDVLLYAVVGGGHTWPGADTALDAIGGTTDSIDATELILSFFDAHPLDAAKQPAPTAD